MAPVGGRDEELRVVSDFVKRGASGPGVLVLEGEPGIGKSTIWRAAVDEAAADRTVLRAEPAASEAALSFSGLSDLLEPVVDDVLPALHEPQRRALEVALLRSEAEHRVPDSRGVAAAFLAVLRALILVGPLVVAIDDLQWLDASSSFVVAYAIRRLRGEPVSFLFARRSGDEGAFVLTDSAQRLEVGALPLDAFRALLRERLPRPLPPETVANLHDRARGNPLYGLELAQAMDSNRPLSQLDLLVAERIASVSADAQRALLIVALASVPDMELLGRALAGEPEQALQELRAAGLVVQDRGRLRTVHPLIGGMVVRTASPAEIRAAHEALAGAVVRTEERARHLAGSVAGRVAAIAAVVAEAARSALERGAPAASSELFEDAARLAEDPAEAAGFLVAAGRNAFLAADPQRGERLIAGALVDLPPGSARAEALIALAAGVGHDVPRAQALFDEALAQHTVAPVRAAGLALRSMFLGALQLRPLDGADDAARALETALEVGNPDLIAQALAAVAWADALLGRGPTVSRWITPAVDEAIARQRPFLGTRRPLLAQRTWRGDLDGVRDELLDMQWHATVAGDEESAAAAALHLIEHDLRSGDWRGAEEHVSEIQAFAELADPIRPIADAYDAAVTARLGDLDRAHAVAERALADAAALGDVLFETLNRTTLGFACLSSENYDAAIDWLAPVAALTLERGLMDPGQFMAIPDLVEALVATGRLADAEPLVTQLATVAAAQDHPWCSLTEARCRALVSAAAGDADGAVSLLAGSLASSSPGALPFERARTQLVLGKTLLRARKRSAARAALTAAVEGFAALGAGRWEERARDEMRRLGGRSASDSLTPAQLRVATLVASGRSNKSVAAELFISENTVESHLRKAYAKLGIRSRTELARALPDRRPRSADHGNP